MADASARPVSPLVAAGPAREHLEALRRRVPSASPRVVAAASGVSRRTVVEVLAGRRARIRQDLSERLLGLGTEDLELPAHALVDAGPTWALLEALLALGYDEGWISQQLGSPARPRLQFGERRVRAETARAVRELFERVGARPAERGE